MRLENKVALITGGYGGMDRASAELLASRERPRSSLVATRSVASPWRRRSATRAARRTSSSWRLPTRISGPRRSRRSVSGRVLCTLMNIVGSNAMVMFPEIDVEEWNKVFEIDVTGTLRGIQRCAPLMKDSGGAAIVNIGSLVGMTGGPGTAYSSSK
jgi:NAD(P)-dependent dehydrogenase (short-subunit alcohol dehydrogenase family)